MLPKKLTMSGVNIENGSLINFRVDRIQKRVRCKKRILIGSRVSGDKTASYQNGLIFCLNSVLIIQDVL